MVSSSSTTGPRRVTLRLILFVASSVRRRPFLVFVQHCNSVVTSYSVIITVIAVWWLFCWGGGNSETNRAPSPGERKSRGHTPAKLVVVVRTADEQHLELRSSGPSSRLPIMLSIGRAGPSTSPPSPLDHRHPDVRVCSLYGHRRGRILRWRHDVACRSIVYFVWSVIMRVKFYLS